MKKDPLRRVDNDFKCPICGRTDWCTYSSKMVICMRVESPLPSKNGGWIHWLDKPLSSLPPVKGDLGIDRRPDNKLNEIYTKLLDVLSLSTKHQDHLLSRGMSVKEIDYYKYRTLPSGNRASILSNFVSEELRGIPGFGFRKNQLLITGKPGLMIPVFSIQSHLVSFVIRPDEQKKGAKYLFFSSRWLKAGANPGARIHLSIPPKKKTDIVWIVEGPLKANMVSWRIGASVIAVPGVGNWQEVKKIKVPKKIRLAYDSDYSNPIVQRHARLLSNYLLDQGCHVEAVLWDKKLAKGPDDALVAEVPMKFLKIRKK